MVVCVYRENITTLVKIALRNLRKEIERGKLLSCETGWNTFSESAC